MLPQNQKPKKNKHQNAFFNAHTNKTNIKPYQKIKPKQTNGYTKQTQQKQTISINQNTYNKKEKKKKDTLLQINPYQHTKTRPITLQNKYTKKHQMNHQINHLKRARPSGLAQFKKHNITNSQKAHTTAHISIDKNKTSINQITIVPNNYKNQKKYQRTHQNYIIRTQILYKDTTQNKCPYNIPHRLSRNKPHQSGPQINYITIVTYLPKPHRKTPIISYHLKTYCPITSPTIKTYACGYTNQNTHYAHKKHTTHHIISTTPSKKKKKQQTKIVKKIIINYTTYQPILCPYIATYNKPTNPPLTQHHKSKIKKTPKHTPTHPQIKLPPIHTNPHPQINTEKPIPLPNKYTKESQNNINYPLNHLKRARPTGLAPSIKHNNITNTQNQMILEKIHTTGHKTNNIQKNQYTKQSQT